MIRYATQLAGLGLMAATWISAVGADSPAAPTTRPAGREQSEPNARQRGQGREAPPAFIRPRDRGFRGDLPWDEGSRRDRQRPARPKEPLDGPDRGADSGTPVGPEQIEELMAFTKAHFPEMYERLDRTRRENAGQFRQMLRTMRPHILRMLQLSREDPQLAEKVIAIQQVEMRLRMLRQRHRPGLPDEQRRAIRSELRRLLEQRFDLRMQRIELEIAGLQKRLDAQRQHKARIIEEELSQLTEPPPARARDATTPPPLEEPQAPVTPAAATR